MKRLRGLLLSLVLLSGCSNVFVYNQLDWLIPWYVNGYLDLTREQKSGFRDQLRPFLRWHREQELREYLELVDRVERDLGEPLDPQTVQEWIDAADLAAGRLEQRALPLAIDLFGELSDAQVEEFIVTLWEQQEELEEDYLGRNDEEYVEEAYRNFEKNLRQFIGRLQPEQKEHLRAASGELVRLDHAWLEERRVRTKTLEEILSTRAPDWREDFARTFATRGTARSADYAAALLHNQGVINNAIVHVANNRTERQSVRLAREAAKLRRDLRKLIGQAAG